MKSDRTSPEVIASLYPRLYSEKRLDEWMALFDPGAIVVRTETGSAARCQSLHDAMPEQREYAAENDTFLEEWRNVEIRRFFGGIATIRADYTLTTDAEIRDGVDMLLLVEGADGWRIVTLAYEQTRFVEK